MKNTQQSNQLTPLNNHTDRYSNQTSSRDSGTSPAHEQPLRLAKQSSHHDELTDLALSNLERLKGLRAECERQRADSPSGFIRVQMKNKSPQYYLRTNPKDFKGKYIKKKNIAIVSQILQRDYSNELLVKINSQIAAIESFLKSYSHIELAEVYDSFSPYRKERITPLVLSDNEFINNWVNEKYESLAFHEEEPELYTSFGLRVRSKSEIIIAEELSRHNIPFRYEFPLYLKGFGMVHPDFMCLNTRTRKEYYWEHLGMLDNVEYISRNLLKLDKYEANGFYPGINLILSFESLSHPLDVRNISKKIEAYLK